MDKRTFAHNQHTESRRAPSVIDTQRHAGLSDAQHAEMPKYAKTMAP